MFYFLSSQLFKTKIIYILYLDNFINMCFTPIKTNISLSLDKKTQPKTSCCATTSSSEAKCASLTDMLESSLLVSHIDSPSKHSTCSCSEPSYQEESGVKEQDVVILYEGVSLSDFLGNFSSIHCNDSTEDDDDQSYDSLKLHRRKLSTNNKA